MTSLRTLLLALGAVAIQAVMVLAFAWPAARVAPREVPLVVAGPATATAAVVQRLDAEQPGAFRVERLAGEDAARRAVTGRRAYGALVVGPDGPHVLIASAASPAVAQLLTQMGQRLSASPAAPPRDVVPADPDDPRGAALGALVLPLVMSGMLGGVLLTFLVGSVAWRLAGLVLFSAVAGLVTAAIVGRVLPVVPGPYAEVAGAIALTTFAVCGAVTGLGALLGRAGAGLGAVTMMLVANPLSGVTSAPEMLPSPWGAVGQAMPAGAGVTLLRSVAFFDGARMRYPLVVLLAWAAGGLLCLALGSLRGRRTPANPVREDSLVAT